VQAGPNIHVKLKKIIAKTVWDGVVFLVRKKMISLDFGGAAR
jgi:hypothetical protein